MSSAGNGFGKRGNVTLAQASVANEPTGGLFGSDNRLLVWGAGALIAVLLFALLMVSTYRRSNDRYYTDSEGRVIYVGGGGGGFMSGLLGGMLGYHMGKQAGAAAAAAQNAAARSMPAAAPASPATQSTTMQRSGFGSTGSSSGSGSAGHSAGG